MELHPYLFVSLFVFYIFSYLLSKTMGRFSGCLISSAGIQKLFCGIYSAFKCSFDEFVGEKVVSPSYSSAILGGSWEGYSKECFVAYPRLLKIKSRYSVKKMIDLQKIEAVKQVTVTQGPWIKWLKFFLLNGNDSLCNSALVKIKFCAFTILSMFINHHLVAQMYFLFWSYF